MRPLRCVQRLGRTQLGDRRPLPDSTRRFSVWRAPDTQKASGSGCSDVLVHDGLELSELAIPLALGTGSEAAVLLLLPAYVDHVVLSSRILNYAARTTRTTSSTKKLLYLQSFQACERTARDSERPGLNTLNGVKRSGRSPTSTMPHQARLHAP